MCVYICVKGACTHAHMHKRSMFLCGNVRAKGRTGCLPPVTLGFIPLEARCLATPGTYMTLARLAASRTEHLPCLHPPQSVMWVLKSKPWSPQLHKHLQPPSCHPARVLGFGKFCTLIPTVCAEIYFPTSYGQRPSFPPSWLAFAVLCFDGHSAWGERISKQFNLHFLDD